MLPPTLLADALVVPARLPGGRRRGVLVAPALVGARQRPGGGPAAGGVRGALPPVVARGPGAVRRVRAERVVAQHRVGLAAARGALPARLAAERQAGGRRRRRRRRRRVGGERRAVVPPRGAGAARPRPHQALGAALSVVGRRRAAPTARVVAVTHVPVAAGAAVGVVARRALVTVRRTAVGRRRRRPSVATRDALLALKPPAPRLLSSPVERLTKVPEETGKQRQYSRMSF